MSSVIEKLADLGIRPATGHPFREGVDVYTLCPECSANRKPQNRNKLVLSVRLDGHGGAIFKCHHCDWSGNVPQDRVGRDGRPVYEAPRREPPRPARPAPPLDQRQRPATLLEFFQRRGIAPDVLEEMGIYFTKIRFPQDRHLAGDPPDWSKMPETPCIAFPYTLNGEVVNHKYRDRNKRFAQDPKTLRTLYNVDQIAPDEVIWVEGEMDVLACLNAGYRSVVSLPDGAPAKLKDEDDPSRATDDRFTAMANCADRLDGLQKVIIATDGDGPGDVLAEELARRLGKDRCWRVYWPEGCKDANEVLVQYGADALRAAIDGARPYPMEGLYDLEPGALVRLRNSPRTIAYSTGYPNLDDMVRVPAEGRLWVITGIPNSGKSEWVDSVLVNTAVANGWHATICSPENNPVEWHAAKLAEKWAGEPFQDGPYLRGMSDQTLRRAEDWVAEHFTFIRQDKPDQELTLEWVLDRASKAVLRRGSRWLVIDPWNRLEHNQTGDISETAYVRKVLDRLGKWGAAHACNVVLIAHPQKLQRERGERKLPVPGGYDISGSAHFYNIPDFGITVHRPDMESPIVEIHVWKVRFKGHGKKGMGLLSWDRPTGRYRPASEEERMSNDDLDRNSRPA